MSSLITWIIMVVIFQVVSAVLTRASRQAAEEVKRKHQGQRPSQRVRPVRPRMEPARPAIPTVAPSEMPTLSPVHDEEECESLADMAVNDDESVRGLVVPAPVPAPGTLIETGSLGGKRVFARTSPAPAAVAAEPGLDEPELNLTVDDLQRGIITAIILGRPKSAFAIGRRQF